MAIFDYAVEPGNPIGSCHLRMVEALNPHHEITVFAPRFQNPRPDRIRWVRIPVIRRPLALLFCTFHLMAPLCYLVDRLVRGQRFDLIQLVESNLLFGDISYAHFCHSVFLKRHWHDVRLGGLRGALRWLDHRLHAVFEPWVFRRVRSVIVPSLGLARELEKEYPVVRGKVRLLPNPVDWESWQRPSDWDRAAFRRHLGLDPADVVMVFAALGQFERKGLPLLLEALSRLKGSRLRLLVVGGMPDLVSTYRKRVTASHLGGTVTFVGMQRDVRPFFWAADAFALLSHYEALPLVALEAGAAGLPLIVTPLNGVEEFLRDGVNGMLVRRDADAVTEGLRRLVEMEPQRRAELGQQARRDVERFGIRQFREQCVSLYSSGRGAAS